MMTNKVLTNIYFNKLLVEEKSMAVDYQNSLLKNKIIFVLSFFFRKCGWMDGCIKTYLWIHHPSIIITYVFYIKISTRTSNLS